MIGDWWIPIGIVTSLFLLLIIVFVLLVAYVTYGLREDMRSISEMFESPDMPPENEPP